jgi:hypothetical protein
MRAKITSPIPTYFQGTGKYVAQAQRITQANINTKTIINMLMGKVFLTYANPIPPKYDHFVIQRYLHDKAGLLTPALMRH